MPPPFQSMIQGLPARQVKSSYISHQKNPIFEAELVPKSSGGANYRQPPTTTSKARKILRHFQRLIRANTKRKIFWRLAILSGKEHAHSGWAKEKGNVGWRSMRIKSHNGCKVLVECGYCRQYTVISSSKLRYTTSRHVRQKCSRQNPCHPARCVLDARDDVLSGPMTNWQRPHWLMIACSWMRQNIVYNNQLPDMHVSDNHSIMSTFAPWTVTGLSEILSNIISRKRWTVHMDFYCTYICRHCQSCLFVCFY